MFMLIITCTFLRHPQEMSKMPTSSPWAIICFTFLVVKSLLLLVTFASPAPGYDTSSQLYFSPPEHHHSAAAKTPALVYKFVRWDAFYFLSVARDGYRWEQQWAFGWGWTQTIAHTVTGESIDPRQEGRGY